MQDPYFTEKCSRTRKLGNESDFERIMFNFLHETAQTISLNRLSKLSNKQKIKIYK